MYSVRQIVRSKFIRSLKGSIVVTSTDAASRDFAKTYDHNNNIASIATFNTTCVNTLPKCPPLG